jgi:hypothetical protein
VPRFTHPQPRKPFLVAGLLTGMALAGNLPWQASAQTGPAPDASSRLAEHWEDVLLLEAIRYLRLSPAQLRQLQPTAQAAEDRLARLREQEERMRTALDRIAQKQREALIRGDHISLQEQSDALAMTQTMKQRREQAAEEITRQIAPQLARLLTRDQIERAYLLARGEMPNGVPPRPALLDPGSGFVLDDSAREQSRVATIQQVLRRRYPEPLVSAGILASIPIQHALLDLGDRSRRVTRIEGDNIVVFRDADLDSLQQFPEALRQAYTRDRRALEDHPEDLARSYIAGATDEDRATILQPLARRLFLSPRLQPVLSERIQKHEAMTH